MRDRPPADGGPPAAPGAALHVRDYAPRDRDAVIALDARTMDPPTVADVHGVLNPDLRDVPAHYAGGAFLVGERGGRVVAIGGIAPLGDGAFEVKRMRVDHEERRRGHARALLTALEARARALGARRLVLETTVQQRAARSLYAAFGYVARHERVLVDGDRRLRVIRYEKPLASDGRGIGARTTPG